MRVARNLRFAAALAALALVVSAVGAGATSATDPDPGLKAPVAYVTITGDTLGQINGSVTEAGREDTIAITGFQHDIVSPRDAASGLATGKRQHSPLVILKEIDKATPLLYSALAQNENLTQVDLRFYRASRTGKVGNYYTIGLVNASISHIKAVADPDTAGKVVEEIAFTYQKIVWTWENGGITAEDDWESPQA